MPDVPHLLIIDDEPEVRELAAAFLEREGYACTLASSEEEGIRLAGALQELDVVLTDLRIGSGSGIAVCEFVAKNRPDVPVVLMTGFSTVDAAIGALRAGAYDYLTKPFEPPALRATIKRATEHRVLSEEVKRLRREVDGPAHEFQMIGQSKPIRQVLDLIDRVGDTDTTILVSGESGTGKELAARALHKRSGRQGRFVAVNCAAMPANLLESELFGHTAGAFTDAKKSRKGLFVEAHRGTLLLDEIGELDLEMQPKLLRALQEGKVRAVGAESEVDVDVRIVAATNRDLEAEVKAGNFREDLYYRVNVVNVHLPPLRARGHDILRLAQSFLERFAERTARPVQGFAEAAAEKLLAYDWPGNVRELQNCVERAVTLARFDHVGVDDLPKRVRDFQSSRVLIDADDPSEMPTLETLERRYVYKVLESVSGNKTAAARVLGVDRRTLYRKLERWEEEK